MKLQNRIIAIILFSILFCSFGRKQTADKNIDFEEIKQFSNLQGNKSIMRKKVISCFLMLNFIFISCKLKSKECWLFSENDERLELIINNDNVVLKSSISSGILDLGDTEKVEGYYNKEDNIITFASKLITIKVAFKSRDKMDIILEDGMILSLYRF